MLNLELNTPNKLTKFNQELMLKAAILDDEVKGSKLLNQKLAFFEDELQVVGVFNHPAKALDALIEIKPDVLFLDVEMLGINGFQFLERLEQF